MTADNPRLGLDQDAIGPAARRHVRIFGRHVPVPGSRVVRLSLGTSLIFAGLFGFLPVLGFWMLPLGLLVLSIDLPPVRRWRRRLEVRWGRWRNNSHAP